MGIINLDLDFEIKMPKTVLMSQTRQNMVVYSLCQSSSQVSVFETLLQLDLTDLAK